MQSSNLTPAQAIANIRVLIDLDNKISVEVSKIAFREPHFQDAIKLKKTLCEERGRFLAVQKNNKLNQRSAQEIIKWFALENLLEKDFDAANLQNIAVISKNWRDTIFDCLKNKGLSKEILQRVVQRFKDAEEIHQYMQSDDGGFELALNYHESWHLTDADESPLSGRNNNQHSYAFNPLILFSKAKEAVGSATKAIGSLLMPLPEYDSNSESDSDSDYTPPSPKGPR